MKRTSEQCVIELHSGKFMSMVDPQPEDVLLSDIAFGLSNICRYTGQVEFYSVAEHAARVALYLSAYSSDEELILAGLHHDDAEAYIGDMNSPLKQQVPQFKVVEHNFEKVIHKAFGIESLPWNDPRIKRADDWCRAYESYYLLPSRGTQELDGSLHTYDPDVYPATHKPLGNWRYNPESARTLWLGLNHQLGGPE